MPVIRSIQRIQKQSSISDVTNQTLDSTYSVEELATITDLRRAVLQILAALRNAGIIDIPASTGIQLNYSAFGDTNGLFYYLGTNGGSQAWSNPVTSGAVVGNSSPLSVGNMAGLVNRTVEYRWYTSPGSNVFVQFDLGANRRFSPTSYTIQHSEEASDYLRYWKLQGSNDAANWVDLDVRSNDTTINAARAWGRFTVTNSSSYRYLRLITTAGNSSYLVIGEIEFYGVLS